MNTALWLLLLIVCIFPPVALSFLMEAARKPPQIPESLYWSKEIPIQYVTIDGMRLRYIKAGQGPALVLLHTLRTQIDIFQKIIPQLTNDFTVYAVDYPGHGFSDIPKRDYHPDFFVTAVENFLQELNIENATLAGISIGGSISLLIITLSRIPVLGETVMRFRNPMVEKIIFQGGVAYPDALPKEYLQQVWDSGVRKGHYRGFINLIRHAQLWETVRRDYAQIKVPVLLVYGDKDWSHEDERQRTLNEVPGAKMEIVNNGGHFLSLDQPDAVIRLIKQYAKT